MAIRYPYISILGKRQVKIISDQANPKGILDFRKYSKIFAEIITESTPAKFTIGLFGGWGTGKTSLMLMIKDELEKNPNILTVWFDAWRYEKEQFLAVVPLLRTIRLALQDFPAEKSQSGKWDNLKRALENTLIAFLKSAKFTLGIPDVASLDIDISEMLKAYKEDRLPGREVNILYYQSIEYLKRALEDLTDSSGRRIAIFIDDLDRCTPSSGLEVFESIKSLFDLDGIIFVVGMNNSTIDSLIKEKFGDNKSITGLDYLKKIVQVPFQMPEWTDSDILTFIDNIIDVDLDGSSFRDEYNQKPPLRELLMRAVESNPREVKRFINQIILAREVFDKPMEKLLVVQALRFRPSWSKFLDLITPDNFRKDFIMAYKKIDSDLPGWLKMRESVSKYYPGFENRNDSLRKFLDAGAADMFSEIEHMEDFRRALESVNASSIVQSGASFTPEGVFYIKYYVSSIPSESPKPIYTVDLWIEAPSRYIGRVKRVKYHLPQDVLSQVLSSDSVENQFCVKVESKGSFTARAWLVLIDGEEKMVEAWISVAEQPSG